MIEHCTLPAYGRRECGREMVVRAGADGSALWVCPDCDGDAAYPLRTNPEFNKPWPRTANE